MLKYTTAQVTFREIPDEVTLCINISNCPIHCPDCHSKELWEDIGTDLTIEELNRILEENKGISCVCFMGGDADYEYLCYLKKFVDSYYWCLGKNIKTALYSGRDSLEELKSKMPKGALIHFDYVKIGPYKKEKGGLDCVNTNQKLYITKCIGEDDFGFGKYSFEDITYKFWKKD